MSADNNSMSPKQLVGLVAAGFAVPIIAGILIAKLSTSINESQPDPATMTKEAVAARVRPAGEVNAGEIVAPGMHTGKQVTESICFSCHKEGLAGSPKFGDTAAWAPRIAQGFDVLTDHAIKGFKGMPAKGGAADLTDDEIRRAVAYMGNAAGGKFTEPGVKGAEAPASGASASAPAAAASTAPAAAPAAAAVDGKAVFSATCTACHSGAMPNAPKLGDKAAWAPRAKQGKDTLYQHALAGFNAMPAKGGNAGLKDEEVKAAVDYMLSQAQ